MKKPHVLNRAMFNQGGTSAYGRGITSNLVSDEQRQKFNYGGRVRANMGLYSGNEFDPIERTTPDFNWNFPSASKLFGYEERIKRPEWMLQREKQEELEGLEDPSDYQVGQDDLLKAEKKAVITDTESDVLGAGTDWEKFAEGLYDKKGAKGKAQLELAGNVLAAAFQPKKEAMAILGKGVGQFGKTVSGRKEKMEDIAATGKMYETIYKTREEEKGIQARLNAAEKANLLKTGTPSEKYMAHIAGEELKPKIIRDAIYKASGSKIIPKMMPGTTEDADKERADPKNEGKIYIQDQQTFILKNGEFEIIDLDAIFETLKP